MTTKWHIVVTGSRPSKGEDGKFLPMPQENVDFIRSVLSKVAPEDTAALYHGMAAGVDTVVDDYAHYASIRVKQFPAYWFNPSKPGNTDKAAGVFRNEVMIRAAIDATYGKPDEGVVVLAFHNTNELSESKGTNHCVEYAKKKNLQVRVFRLPVLKNNKELASSVPNPFDK